MKRNAILTIIAVFVCIAKSYSQCDFPAAPGVSCQSAIAFCNNEIDGFCSATYNSGVVTPVSMPPFCGSVQNNLWIQFVAGTPSISLEFTIDNCLNGDGLQAMVMHSDDCVDFTAISNCYTASVSGGGSGTIVFQLDANNYEVGETYYVMIDGWLGDYCDFSIEVVQGSTSVPALSTADLPNGPTAICAGANSITYTIPAVPYASGYNWSVPAGATYTLSADELSITVDYSTSFSGGSICVEPFNDCETGTSTCLPITLQSPPSGNDYGAYCAGQTFYYPVNNTNYTEGTYFITLNGASYLGCDSLVVLEVVENPIKETFISAAICEGENYEIAGILFTETNNSIAVPLTSAQGCDSTVYLDLTVLNPSAVLQTMGAIDCNNQTTLINGVLSNTDTYQWSSSNGGIIGGQGTPLITVDAGGTYTLDVTMEHLGVVCTSSSSIQVDENFSQPVFTVSTDDVDCNGDGTGTATVNITSGLPPYTYQWSNGATTPTVDNLSPGGYNVTVTGANGCDHFENFGIFEPTTLDFNIVLGNISCNGAQDGTANINVSGGQAPYTYAWSTGSTSDVEAGLSPGIYEITISDANACSIIETFEILEPDAIQLSITADQPACLNENGSATVVASGGTGTYSYLWDVVPVQSTASAFDLPEGTYTVTVFDQNNCQQSISIDIVSPTALSANISTTDLTCFESLDGSISVNPLGGAGNYSYQWSNGTNTASLTNLSAGVYELTLTDDNNCQEIISTTINQPEQLSLSITGQNIDCSGGDNGSALVNVSGGTAPYQYQWDDLYNQSGVIATSLYAGVYTVTVTDANNCSAEETITITEPGNALSVNVSATSATCGSSNGAIELTVNGGTTPYGYTWTNGIPNLSNPINLGAGTYGVTITDANGCSVTETAVINTPTGLELMLNTTNTTCAGISDGYIDAIVSGGLAPYTYTWSDISNNGNEDFSNLNVGTYSLTVTDADGCEVVASTNVESPDVLTGIITANSASCGGADGSISLTINGGTGPYDYDWSMNALDGIQNPSGLFPGYYSVLVSDANGCSVSLATDIIIPDGPSVVFTKQDATCHNTPTGSIDLTISGGEAPYEFIWDNGLANQEDHVAVSAGNYSVTITDQNNCIVTTNIIIDEPTPITTSIYSENVSCSNGNDGMASITVVGGITPYNYQWSNGAATNVADNLSAGTATVTITDANGCQIIENVVIDQPVLATVDVIIENPSCFDLPDANINLEITNGVEPFDFLWSNGSIEEDQLAVDAGNYSVTITDANNCTQVYDNIIIENPTPISVTATTVMADCNTANGAIDLVVSGGSGMYDFDWSMGLPNVQNQTDLISGTYTVVVYDENGCSVSNEIEVPSPSGLVVTSTVVEPSCFDALDGSIDINVTGGAAPFQYDWSHTINGIEDPGNLQAGSYTVIVTDANNCSTSLETILNAPEQLSVVSTITEAFCGAANGAISLIANGGTAPYNFEWNNGDLGADINTLAAGDYEVTITDANNCTLVENLTVTTPNALQASMVILHPLCVNENNGSLNLIVSGGQEPYIYEWENDLGSTSGLSNLEAGSYSVTVTDASGCSEIITSLLENPAELSASFENTFAACGNANGSIDVSVSGGIAPYSFNWQGGIGTMEDPSGLDVGTYQVLITDANGCTLESSTEILSPPPFFINDITTISACSGDNTSMVNLNVEGGVSPYQYSWDNGSISEDLENLIPGVYTVVVTDALDCTIQHTVEIIEPEPLEIFTIQTTDVNCNGGANGAILLEVVGGTGTYSFDWDENTLDGIQNPSNLIAGNYALTVSDENGCFTDAIIEVGEIEALEVFEDISPVTCFNGGDGSISLGVSGGTMPYVFEWSNGSDAALNADLTSGTYEVLITDANACSQILSFTLENPSPIGIAIDEASDYSGFGVSCIDANDGFITLNGFDGLAPYSFVWPDGVEGATHTDLSAGYYQVTITDANGCIAEDEFTITTPEQIQVDLQLFDPSCFDENDGWASILNTTGGVGSYLYAFEGSSFSTMNRFEGLESGEFELQVQDANGCEISEMIYIENPQQLIVDIGDEISLQLGDSVQLQPLIIPNDAVIDTIIWSEPVLQGVGPWIRPISTQNISVNIIDENGCTATDDVLLKVQKERLVYAPNVFSPNDDGLNDIYIPHFGTGVEKVNTFRVFNRWGELLHENLNVLPTELLGWDGYVKNQKAAIGVYVYYIEVVFSDGRIEQYRGDLTLIR